MKDAEEVLPSDILSRGEQAVVRLILQHPGDGRVLLVRYPVSTDEYEPGKPSKDMPTAGTYWSYKGIGPLRPYGQESTIAEMVVRVAYQQLGIRVHDLELLVTFYDRRVQPAKLGRLYYLIREWSGETPYSDDLEPTSQAFSHSCKADKWTPKPKLSHEHFWVPREFLGSYFRHPEVIAATRAWDEWEMKRAKGAGA